jgi:exodeoxyribonuclease V alpha subunit
MSLPPLEEFLANEAFSILDRHFARQVAAWASPRSKLAGHAAALASQMLQRRHLCIALDRVPSALAENGMLATGWPTVAEWREDLLASGVVATNEQTFLPLLLSATHKLYLHRYAEYEQSLAAGIEAHLASDTLRVIVGGPGTGKTYTLLHTLIDRLANTPTLRIALAAPTGKAAQRMEESIHQGLASMTIDDSIRSRIPARASTLHRLLGSRGDSAFPLHNSANPLPVDLVIIDEASMVDLPMMAKLFAALAPRSQLMLVGDPDQLASVEVGSVLADIVAAAAQNPTLGQALQRLRTPHRFGADSGIGRLCEAIREGDHAGALAVLEDDRFPDVRLRSLPTREAIAARLHATPAFQRLQAACEHRQPEVLLAALGSARILCPLRRGPWGIEGLNTAAEQLLHDAGVIDRDRLWYEGRPILVLRNDYDVQLFNGDAGVVLNDRISGEHQVIFPGEGGDIRRFSPTRLPQHQTNYAMTVHRSQGSEFDHVLVVLPPTDGPLLSRELLYTAVSRARHDVEIWADAETLRKACERPASRASGLAERLVPQAGGTAYPG